MKQFPPSIRITNKKTKNMNNKNFKFNVAFNLIKLINYSLETIEKKGGKKVTVEVKQESFFNFFKDVN